MVIHKVIIFGYQKEETMKWKATLQIKQKEITENTFNGKNDNSLKEEKITLNGNIKIQK